jgi:hypothetical protein
MVKKVLLVLVVALGIGAIYVSTRPETYRVERSAKVAAPPAAVYAVIGDFKTFTQWSPWMKRDPGVKTTVSTPSTGVGASYAWEGNKDVGKGKMTIIESTPPAAGPGRVRERLEFMEPFASVAEAGFDIKPEGEGAATVVWSIDGKHNFIGKAFSVFMDMDKMLGKDFEDGLANLKKIVETRPAAGG